MLRTVGNLRTEQDPLRAWQQQTLSWAEEVVEYQTGTHRRRRSSEHWQQRDAGDCQPRLRESEQFLKISFAKQFA